MIKEPYKPAPDPTTRLIQIRGVKHKTADEQIVRMEVPLSIQEFFGKLLNRIGHRSDWFASCITCVHWNFINAGSSGNKHCSKFNCMPPPEVIADGCEYYEDEDIIPF